jgi:hypothetical protein
MDIDMTTPPPQRAAPGAPGSKASGFRALLTAPERGNFNNARRLVRKWLDVDDAFDLARARNFT